MKLLRLYVIAASFRFDIGYWMGYRDWMGSLMDERVGGI